MCVCVCALQVHVTVANASALPKTGGCLESTVSVTTESVTNMKESSAQVDEETHTHTHTPRGFNGSKMLHESETDQWKTCPNPTLL